MGTRRHARRPGPRLRGRALTRPIVRARPHSPGRAARAPAVRLGQIPERHRACPRMRALPVPAGHGNEVSACRWSRGGPEQEAGVQPSGCRPIAGRRRRGQPGDRRARHGSPRRGGSARVVARPPLAAPGGFSVRFQSARRPADRAGRGLPTTGRRAPAGSPTRRGAPGVHETGTRQQMTLAGARFPDDEEGRRRAPPVRAGDGVVDGPELFCPADQWSAHSCRHRSRYTAVVSRIAGVPR